jgi:hypothetical protein
MEIKMKNILYIVLSIGFVNNVIAGTLDHVGIHFYNKTSSTIYLTSKYTENDSGYCKGTFLNLVTVKPGDKYKFSITHKKSTKKACYLVLLGSTNKNFTESSIALQEYFSIEKKSTRNNALLSSHVSSHETPPSKCGLGMACSTHLTNNTTSLYIQATNENNQYAHIMVYNNKLDISYVKFEYIKGPCSNNIKDGSWLKILPRSAKLGYIFNSHKGRVCTYKIHIQSRYQRCSTELEIYNDFNNNNLISLVDGSCNTVISKDSWLANITLN